MAIYKKNIDNLFYIFITSHLLIWTVVPSLTNHNLPLDTIEALAWGSNLDWGYSKHPPLSAFAVELFYFTFGSRSWSGCSHCIFSIHYNFNRATCFFR